MPYRVRHRSRHRVRGDRAGRADQRPVRSRSVANTITDGRYRKLAAAFNFDTDGTVKSDGAQSATQLDTTKTGYLANYDDAAVAADKSASNLYRSHVETIGNVDDFINDRGLFSTPLRRSAWTQAPSRNPRSGRSW